MATLSDKRRLVISRKLDSYIIAEESDTQFRKDCVTLKRSITTTQITQDHVNALLGLVAELTKRGEACDDDGFRIAAEIRAMIA